MSWCRLDYLFLRGSRKNSLIFLKMEKAEMRERRTEKMKGKGG